MVTDTPPVFDERFRAQFAELLRWRRDVRHFLTTPIPRETVDRLLTYADLAPSVGNSQPWRFVLVETDERRVQAIANFEAANAAALRAYSGEAAKSYAALKLAGLRDAPVHLAVFCETDPEQGTGLGRQTMPETLSYSAVGAIQTLWLAARSEGIGVGWVSILDPAQLTADLDVPAGWHFVAYLCIGYPKTDDPTPELERVGWQARSPYSDRVFRC